MIALLASDAMLQKTQASTLFAGRGVHL